MTRSNREKTNSRFEKSNEKLEEILSGVRAVIEGEIITKEVINKYVEGKEGEEKEKRIEELENELKKLIKKMEKEIDAGKFQFTDQESLKTKVIEFFKTKKKFGKLVKLLKKETKENKNESEEPKENAESDEDQSQEEDLLNDEEIISEDEKQDEKPEEKPTENPAEMGGDLEQKSVPTLGEFVERFGLDKTKIDEDGKFSSEPFVSAKDTSELRILGYNEKSGNVSFEVTPYYELEDTEDEEGRKTRDVYIFSDSERKNKTETFVLPFEKFEQKVRKEFTERDEAGEVGPIIKKESPEEEEKIILERDKKEGKDFKAVFTNQKGEFLTVANYRQRSDLKNKSSTVTISKNGGEVKTITYAEFKKMCLEEGFDEVDQKKNPEYAYDVIVAENIKKQAKAKERAGENPQKKEDGGSHKKSADSRSLEDVQKKDNKTFEEGSVVDADENEKAFEKMRQEFGPEGTRYVLEDDNKSEEVVFINEFRFDQKRGYEIVLEPEDNENYHFWSYPAEVMKNAIKKGEIKRVDGKAVKKNEDEQEEEPVKDAPKTEQVEQKVEFTEKEMKMLKAYRNYAINYKNEIEEYDYKGDEKYKGYENEEISRLKSLLWDIFWAVVLPKKMKEKKSFSGKKFEQAIEQIKQLMNK